MNALVYTAGALWVAFVIAVAAAVMIRLHGKGKRS